MLLNNNISSYSTYANTTNKRLAIYQVAQEKNFWCGYAAIKSLLDFEKVDMTQEEIDEARREKMSMSLVKRDKHGKIVRKSYSPDTRKLIYLNAHGRCELCGRKILLDDMTIDHVKPLSMGGEDDVENLSCTCYPCNILKGNILPDDFMERTRDIFLYQAEKKCRNKLKWKVVHSLLVKIL